MADCLYECLKEASLERYHKRFSSQGLVSCDELVNLSMHDYAAFGVVSMEDRVRLYQLVQIMRSVQHDGNHGDALERMTLSKNQNQSAAISANVEGNTNGNNRLNVTSEVEVRVCAPEGSECAPERGCPTATLQSQGLVDALRRSIGGGFVTAAEDGVSSTVGFRKGSDSPLFHCRKTLTFSGSDTEEDGASLRHPSSHSNVGVAAHNFRMGASLQLQHPIAASIISERCPPPNQQNLPVLPTNLQKNRSIQHFQFVPLNDNHRPDVETHAYFPVADSPPPSKITYVETIVHSAGYNYGLPNVTTKPPGGATNGAMGKSVERIKVCVRKRPLLAREVKQAEVDIVDMKDAHIVSVEEMKLAVDLTKFLQKHMFAFDEVFDESCSNEDLYARTVKSLISCVFERGSATCFAFGQTGAGKTYTLMGNKSVPGLYQLAGRDILDTVHSADHRDNELHLWISYYEIYCGQLFDLLNKRKRLNVRENVKQKVCISGLMETEVRDAKRLVQVVHYGNSVRSKGSTGVNPTSSRSHAVLQMEVRDSSDSRVGRMSFIDLAGSERASDMTHSSRQTRIEGAEINQSLLALKECIRSIDQESQHTPYRQSKLTHILRDSFVGNSQTVMIANVSPCQSACENTLNTLRYADRVKALKKDTPPKVIRTLSTQDSAKNSKKTAPSLFHPSNIQLSSTPKVNRSRYIGNRGDTGSHGDTVDLSKVLQEAYDTPVRGHRMRVSLSERRKQQRELLKQQANDARNRSVNLAKSFESCDSGQPLVTNSGGNWSDAGAASHSGSSSGSGCGKQGARGEIQVTRGGTLPPSMLLKERRLLSTVQGKSERRVTERVSSPGSSPGSHSGFSRHPSRHIKSHDLGDYDNRQRSGEARVTDHENTSTSSFSPKTTNQIFEEHKEIMSHLNLVIGRAKAVMTKAANRKHVDPVPTDGATEPITDARVENNGNDATKSTSVRRKLAWDNDWDNDSQASGAVVGESTAPENGNVLLPAWATRESVIIKHSLDDVSLLSNTSDLSVTSCEIATNSAETVSKFNFRGAALGGISSLCFQSDVSKRDANRINSPVKRETWPQPSRVLNDERDGEAKDCGKFSDGEAKDCGKFSDGEVKDCGEFSDFNLRAGDATEFRQGAEVRLGNEGRRNHSNEASIPIDSPPIIDDMSAVPRSFLPMGDDLLQMLERVKVAHSELSDEKVEHAPTVRSAYSSNFPSLLRMPANVRQPCRSPDAGCFTTAKIIEKLDAAIEKIASETSVIKQASPRTLRLRSSHQDSGSSTENKLYSGTENNAEDDGTVGKQSPCAGEANVRKDINENFRQCNMNSSDVSTPSSAQNSDAVLSHGTPVGETVKYSEGSSVSVSRSRNASIQGATAQSLSPKDLIKQGSAFTKVHDTMVRSQSGNPTESHPNAESHIPKPNIGPHLNGLKYILSPIRMEKLSSVAAVFSPIQCFPVTPRDNHVISVPSIVTKTLLKGHSEPVVGDARPFESKQNPPLSSGGEATQSTGDMVASSAVTKSMLNSLLSSDINLRLNREKMKNGNSPQTDDVIGNHTKLVTSMHLHQNEDENDAVNSDRERSTEKHSDIPATVRIPDGHSTAVSDPLIVTSISNMCDQSPMSVDAKFLQSPDSQGSVSRSSSVQSGKATALQRSQVFSLLGWTAFASFTLASLGLRRRRSERDACESCPSKQRKDSERNLLVGEHERELAEVTALCKQEMQLLMAVRTGEKTFDDYLSVLDNIVLSKMAAITTLQSHIREFSNVSETD